MTRIAWLELDPGSAIPGLWGGKMVCLIVLLSLATSAQAEPRAAVCRVHNQLAACSNVGSGTLVDRSDDGREGLVLTCAHLFSEGVGSVVVEFPSGKSHGAKLVAIDREADLAALAIANPSAESAVVAFELRQAQRVRACGFGPSGEYRCAEGPVVGEARNAGQESILIGGAVRSGDSGGGVFDTQGNLVAVVWGESGGVTYASAGAPLRRFLDRVLGKRAEVVHRCPGGMCPRVPPGELNMQRPPATGSLGASTPEGSPLEELLRRIEALEQNKQDCGDYVTRGEMAGWDAKPQAAGDWVGIAGPTGWGLMAVTTVGGWLVGRLLKRGVGGRRAETFPCDAKV